MHGITKWADEDTLLCMQDEAARERSTSARLRREKEADAEKHAAAEIASAFKVLERRRCLLIMYHCACRPHHLFDLSSCNTAQCGISKLCIAG